MVNSAELWPAGMETEAGTVTWLPEAARLTVTAAAAGAPSETVAVIERPWTSPAAGHTDNATCFTKRVWAVAWLSAAAAKKVSQAAR